jgi:hypothetical protein
MEHREPLELLVRLAILVQQESVAKLEQQDPLGQLDQLDHRELTVLLEQLE